MSELRYTAEGDTRRRKKREQEEKTESPVADGLQEALRQQAQVSAQQDALGQELGSYAEERAARYQGLLEALLHRNYRETEEGAGILQDYAAQGDRIAAHTAAEGAAANGGYPDSYAAAQANRQKIAYMQAGEAAAQAAYDDHLAEYLSLLEQSGEEMADIFSSRQDYLDSAKQEADARVSLFEELQAASVSPMQIDAEYQAMTQGENAPYTASEAWMVLWDKYPGMRAYLLEKYTSQQEDTYQFGK